jgi:hypothetical protein
MKLRYGQFRILQVLAIAAACPGVAGILGCESAGGSGPDIHEVVTQCSACHDIQALGTPLDSTFQAPRDWMALHGEGLVRVDPLFPEPGLWWNVPWPKRGYHDEGALADCSGCHPVSDDGFGHGIRTFRFPEMVFTGGMDCASSCHEWLPAQAAVDGFEPSSGTAPRYEGSMRPGDLLAAGGNAHSDLWVDGAIPARPESFGYGSFNAGCGGCHQIATEDHGHVTTCRDCHRFGGSNGPLHILHVAAIASRADRIDPELAATGSTFCAYCHADGDEPGTRASRVCYNCHLSGHQPLDQTGRPHFWQ